MGGRLAAPATAASARKPRPRFADRRRSIVRIGKKKRKNFKKNQLPMKYIAYCRKSTDEKDKQVLSIEAQITELKEFANDQT